MEEGRKERIVGWALKGAVLLAVSALSFFAGRHSVRAELRLEIADQGEELVGKSLCLKVVEKTCRRVVTGVAGD